MAKLTVEEKKRFDELEEKADRTPEEEKEYQELKEKAR